jgi:hypothetical protein
MRKYLCIWAVIAGTAVFASGTACADTVALHGGDVLSGELLSICNGTVTFLTSLSGQMVAPVEEVRSLTTDSYVNVSLSGAPPTPARFVAAAGTFRLVYQDGTSTELPDLTAVTSALPLGEHDAEISWETGLHWRSGNDDYADLYARLGLMRDTKSFGVRSSWLLERADATDFPRWFRSDTEWRLGPADRFSPFAAIEIERDTDAALALRGSLTLGMGKRLFETASQQLDAGLGLGATSARYDADLLQGAPDRIGGAEALRAPGWRIDDHESAQYLHLRLRLRYAHTLFQNGAFEGDLTLFPNLSDLGEVRARSESAVLFPVTSRLRVKFDLLVDFESDPEFSGLDEWRTSVGASLLWNF